MKGIPCLAVCTNQVNDNRAPFALQTFKYSSTKLEGPIMTSLHVSWINETEHHSCYGIHREWHTEENMSSIQLPVDMSCVTWGSHTEGVQLREYSFVSFPNNWWISHHCRNTGYLSVNICIWTNKMHKILVIRLYFPLDDLHVSDYISPSSGATS